MTKYSFINILKSHGILESKRMLNPTELALSVRFALHFLADVPMFSIAEIQQMQLFLS